MPSPVNLLARGLLSGVFIRGGIDQVKVDAAKEEYDVAVEVSGEDLVRLNGAGMTLAGGALALGIAPRLCAAALIGMLVPTTIVGHPFWKIDDEGKRRTAMSGAFNNAAIAGGLLLVLTRRKRR